MPLEPDGAARELASAPDDDDREPASAAEPGEADDLVARMHDTPGLAPLVAEAVATWRARATADGQQTYDDAASGVESAPGWRAFTDAFPTFWEFTNRPR